MVCIIIAFDIKLQYQSYFNDFSIGIRFKQNLKQNKWKYEKAR